MPLKQIWTLQRVSYILLINLIMSVNFYAVHKTITPYRKILHWKQYQCTVPSVRIRTSVDAGKEKVDQHIIPSLFEISKILN
jgi:hypothetical protein